MVAGELAKSRKRGQGACSQDICRQGGKIHNALADDICINLSFAQNGAQEARLPLVRLDERDLQFRVRFLGQNSNHEAGEPSARTEIGQFSAFPRDQIHELGRILKMATCSIVQGVL